MARLKPRVPLFCFYLLLLLHAAGCAPRQSVPFKRRPQGIYHVVKAGENLFRIGQAYDVPYQELARINRIEPDQIHAGHRIFIPGATRQLPVEIITPVRATLERPKVSDQAEKGRVGFIWPVSGELTSRFGPRGETFHDGIDIFAAEGTPVRAIEKGEVLYSDQLRGYGNLVIIRHSGGFVSVYGHNRKNMAQEGRKVAQGETIAEVGSTGRVSGPHLHFEIRKDNVAQNPLYYLPQL